MCVCVCVSACVSLSASMYMHFCLHDAMDVHSCVCLCVCVCVRAHTRVRPDAGEHTRIRMRVCVCVCTSKKVGRDLKSGFHFPSTTTTHPPPLEAISRGSVARFVRNRSPVETGRCNLTQTPRKRSTQEQLVPSWDQSFLV